MAAACAALAGCGAAPTAPRITVSVTPANARASSRTALQFRATVAGAENRAVAWWVREPTGCGTVSQEGVWTGPLVTSPRVCHVVATSHQGARSASASIEVTGRAGALVVREGPTPAGGAGRRQFGVAPARPVSWAVAEREAEWKPPAFPLRVSSDGHYLEDKEGRPFRIRADAAWFMSANATPEEVDAYLALRQAQGFNSFYLMAMVHPGSYTGIPTAPANRAGLQPFRPPGAFTRPSEPYWRWIDFLVDRAASRGFAVMLAYTYLGYEGGPQGWYQEVLAQPSREACHEWGLWLGRRYKAKSNVVWFALGDYHPPTGSEGSIRVRRILDGIKEAGATQLFMAEMSPPDTLPSDVPDFADAIDQNSFYGYGPGGNGLVYETASRAWAVTPPRPAWQQEGIYELDSNVPAFTGASWETRRARFWSVLAGGIAGDGFGSRDAYRWAGVPASLFTPGARDSAIAFRFFASLPWWTLRPSGTGPGYAGRDLVTSGGGRRGSTDYVTAALAGGGTHLVAYIPPTGSVPRTITVDLGSLAFPARTRWFNPASGAWTDIQPHLTSGGPRAFTTPGDNGTGLNDWVLVLDPDVAPAARCGTITPSGLYTPAAQIPAGVVCQITATSRSDRSVQAALPVTR